MGSTSLGREAARENSTIVVNGQHVSPNFEAGIGPWGSRSIADTPYSVTVMSSEQIENTIARDLDQLYKMNPVVQTNAPSTIFGYPNVRIRGFDSSTGIVDGVRLSSYTYGLSTEEIEKVEVMNGLSGFLYGSGNVGGVSNYVLKRPTYETLANVAVGNYGGSQYFGHVDLGGKITSDDTLAFRFNGAYANGGTSKDDQHLKKWLVSGALDWNVTSDLLVQLEAAHTYWHLDRVDTRFYTNGLGYWPAAYDNSKTYTPGWTYNQTTSDRIGVNLKYKISDAVSLRSAYMYKEDEREYVIIYPIDTPTGWSTYNISKTFPYDTISQGAYTYLDVAVDTGPIAHKLTIGGSWDTYKEVRHVVGNVPGTYADGITPYPAGSGLTLDELLNMQTPRFDGDPGPLYKASSSNNFNAIVGDDITFTDTLSALVGFNYSTIRTRSYSIPSVNKAPTGYRKSALTPTVSLIYKPVPALTTYASYMEAMEAGTIVPNDETIYTNPGEVMDPIISRQFEVGAKYAFSGRLLLTSALFRIEKANSYSETGSDNMVTVRQDGRQVHQGVELTVDGQVTDNLRIVAGGTWMDLGIEKSTPALRGKKPIGSSALMAKASLEYTIPAADGLVLSGGAYYSGSKYQDAANANRIDGYTLFDAGIRYRTEALGRPTTFNLYVSNLTNKDYWSSYWQLGLPRTIAFSARTEF
jgi:iron complex outermembrane receptor protein